MAEKVTAICEIVTYFMQGYCLQFFLEVENSFDGTLRKSDGVGFPETLKDKKQTHGIGFINMKKTAEKYGGGVDFSVRENKNAPGQEVFTLTVMLK